MGLNLGASKMLMATRDLINLSNASLTHFRPLTSASLYTTRLVPQPPELIRWVRREGGFVHKGLKIADGESYGLGLVTSEDISEGSELISLPNHVPLSFPYLESDSDLDGPTSTLIQLGRRVPGFFGQLLRDCWGWDRSVIIPTKAAKCQ